jgi:transposase
VITELGNDIFAKLKEIFPNQAETLFTLAALRVIEPNPFKRAQAAYDHSYLSETFKDLRLSGKDISIFLKAFGDNRDKMVEFMCGFIGENEHILFDGTSLISRSDKMNINRLGYNAHREYEPQVNLLYVFSCGAMTPAYYRIVPGNVADISAFKLSLTETKLKNLIVVADKGFGSKANFDLLEKNELKYIIPLRRNNCLFDTSKLEAGNKSEFEGYFLFNERPIWYYRTAGTIVYIDNDLKNEEEKDYIMRIEKKLEGFTKEGFIERQFKFGSIVLKTNLDKTPQEVYSLYKERCQIEQSFDFMKNLLEQDKSYMQNEKSLETWAFINHLALMLNYKIYNLLRIHNLLAKYSVSDFICHLKYVFKVKADSQWLSTEISAKTTKLLSALGLHIT